MSVEIIAEIGNAHNGDPYRAVRLINAAKAAGADTVKFQCYTPQELVDLRGDGPAPEPWGGQGWTMRNLYEKAQTPHEWFPRLAAHCDNVGIPWFSSVFGAKSLALLESLGCPRYKLASLDYGAARLREMVERTGKPLIVSTTDGRAVFRASFASTGPRARARYLFCPPGYPQAQSHLSQIAPHLYDGFSYHGTDICVPIYAVAAGARIIECHLQLAAEPNELEANVSLTEIEFEAMVDEIRAVEALL